MLSTLRCNTSVFFKWWWAVLTAIATFLPLFGLPARTTVSSWVIAIVLFAFFLLLFLTLAVVSRGYKWYLGSHNAPSIESCLPAIPGQDEEILTISSIYDLELGQILTVLRTTNHGTGCFGIIKVDRRLGSLSDKYQCSPLWIAPGHRNDLAQNQVQPSQLSTSLLLNYNDLANLIKGT
jgi:hypothetical protein